MSATWPTAGCAAAIGIGAAIVAIALAVRPFERRVGRVLLLAVAVFGIATVVLGITHNYAVAFAAVMILSGADMVSVYIRSTLTPLLTPDSKRGRVLAVESVFIGASNELGAFESGVAANAFGTKAAVVGGGIATLAIVVFYWFAFASMRLIDRFSDITPSETDPAPK